MFMLKNISIDLIYQPIIDNPPYTPQQLHSSASSADQVTIDHWEKIWIDHYQRNKDHFGSFASKSIGQLHNINQHRPAIVIGSGPSLKDSLQGLRMNQRMKKPLLTISCLHNFGYFQDEGVEVDYYFTLDAGKIVIDDISEGRKESDYWDKTKDKTLLAYASSDPELLKKWQGPIYLFNCLIPDLNLRNKINEIETFTHYISSGGNALGGCMYVAKAIMGSPKIIFVGADFCFSYDNQFHSYKTHYDDLGQFVLHPDVFGIPRKTWHSYLNFKFWFDKTAMTVPGEWVNASFGLLGSYLGGNIKHFQYMPLETALVPYMITETVDLVNPSENEKYKLDLTEFYKNTCWKEHVALF